MTAPLRYDLKLISGWIKPGSRVLELGCGEGELLGHLKKDKQVTERGIEMAAHKVVACIEKGISALQGDINEELKDYPDDSFDYAVCSQTLQQVYDPEVIIKEMLRVARRGVVSFPNFGHIRVRYQLAVKGCAPVTPDLPFQWHDTPNIRVLSLNDFKQFAARTGFKILKKAAINTKKQHLMGNRVFLYPNLFATYGIFLIGRKE